MDIIISSNVTSSGNEIAEHIAHLTLKSITPTQIYSHVVEKRLNFKTEKSCQILFFFSSEARGIRDQFQVEILQDQAQLMLNDYIMTRQTSNKYRFGKLLLLLPMLRTLSPRAVEDVFFRQTIGSIPIERLLCDMFKCQVKNKIYLFC